LPSLRYSAPAGIVTPAAPGTLSATAALPVPTAVAIASALAGRNFGAAALSAEDRAWYSRRLARRMISPLPAAATPIASPATSLASARLGARSPAAEWRDLVDRRHSVHGRHSADPRHSIDRHHSGDRR